MELLFGQSLWSLWDACRARGVRLRYDMIAWIGARVAEGLHYAHELVDEHGAPLDIVHRDVNATNIFVTYDGEIKVIDFGLAKAANRASKTAAGVIKGKVAYMSPEQAVGAPIDRRTDVFALGTTLWELACDRRLFKHSDDVETLRRVHAAEVPDATRIVDGFPPALWRVLERALARDKEQRYRDGRGVRARSRRDLARDGHRRERGPAAVAKVMRELFAEDRPGRSPGSPRRAAPSPSRRLGPAAQVALDLLGRRRGPGARPRAAARALHPECGVRVAPPAARARPAKKVAVRSDRDGGRLAARDSLLRADETIASR